MRKRIILLSAWACLLTASTFALDPAVEAEKGKDVVLRALVDEMERNRTGLKLEDMEKPYFLEFTLRDGVGVNVSATLGAVTGNQNWRGRGVNCTIRVGTYELDNTNFSGGYGGYGGAPVPLEEDYNGIRQAIWLACDRQYKSAAEAYVKKRAFMESKTIEDKPNDFSREEVVVHLEPRVDPKADAALLATLAIKLSGVFCDYPLLRETGVNVAGGGGNEYLVNTEGTCLRKSSMHFAVHVNASLQAPDGMIFSDSFSANAKTQASLPTEDELVKQCRAMAERLMAVSDAPLLDTYTGPVLFDAQPAATIFGGSYGYNFGGGQRPLGSGTNPDDFAKKLGKRILPRFINVVDDPTQETIAGKMVSGHYQYDGQGVRARAVQLVEEGRLKTLLMSRNPSKEFDKSTGHGGGYGGASASCLIITAKDGEDADGLKRLLLEACEEEDLPFGLRVARLGGLSGGGGYGGYYGGYGSEPLVMYKVFPDGREEMVRGAEFGDINLKSFKRMLAAGDTPFVLNQGRPGEGRTVVAPAMLFEELDLAKMDVDFEKPPVIKAPLARATKDGS